MRGASCPKGDWIVLVPKSKERWVSTYKKGVEYTSVALSKLMETIELC